ncbi:MAG TPA: glycerophosphodiester phosphodiesterase [Blastocatellia bacterium]|nr:glycerophosphodiester phosphodiesterase [Blastocatellia bacterium]
MKLLPVIYRIAIRFLVPCALLFSVLYAAGDAQTRMSASRSRETVRPFIIAHRGGASEFTENTIPAFQRALRLGADGIETDLRLTRDGVVILYHDDRFGRVEGLAPTQITKRISDMTYRELSGSRLKPVGEDDGRSFVPTLADLLGSVRSGLLNIEIKRGDHFDDLVEKTIDLLKTFPDLDRVVLEPPDLDTAKELRSELGPRLKLHINPGYDGTVDYHTSLERVLKFKPHSISVYYKKVSIELIEKAHREGVEVWVWTVDSEDTARAMALLGVDAIKTDRPAALVSLIKKKNGLSRQ